MSSMVSEQNLDPIESMSIGKHFGNLFVGLLLGLVVTLFDRRSQSMAPVAGLRPQTRSWGRTLFSWLGGMLLVFLLIMLVVGP